MFSPHGVRQRLLLGCSLLWLSLVTAFAQSRAARVAPFQMVENGRPACSIVTADQPTPSARLAALELQTHLLEITGAEIPILSESKSVEGRRILVGDTASSRRMGFRADEIPSQQAVIGFRPGVIVLIGRDWRDTPEARREDGRTMIAETLQGTRYKIDYWKAVGHPERSAGQSPLELPGLYDDQGTCYAVYEFLERFLGVRWFGPTPLHVITPHRASVAVEGSDVRFTPAMPHRSALAAGNWPFLHGQWGEFSQDQVHLHWRRIREGGERWAGNHTFHRATIQSTFTDPEYQSKNPKTQGSQLCYSNPKLIAKVVQMARDYFDGRGTLPEGWKAVGDYFSIVPDDNMNLCNCADCTALLQRGVGHKTGYFSSGEMSDYWFTFVNNVAREVRKTHPNKYIATLAYWAYAVPPSFPMEPNVSVAPCLHTCYDPVHSGMKGNDLALYEGWRAKSSAPMFLWVYYHHPMEPALIGRWKSFPHVMVHQTAQAMRRFVRDGVHGIYECGEQDQVEQYVMSRVWRDPSVDVDATLHEFFRLYFGPSSEPMERFYRRLESIACDPANYPVPYHKPSGIDWKRVAWEKLGTPDRMKELGDLIRQAESLSGSGPERKRVELWKAALWNWMEEGAQFKMTNSK